MKRWNKKAHPLLAGIKIEEGRIAVWCPFCRKYHIHGWDGRTDSDASHRVAHCGISESPFDDGGYYITVAPRPPR